MRVTPSSVAALATLSSLLVSAALASSDASVPVRRNVRARGLAPRRTTSLLINPDPQPDLPSPQQASRVAAAAGLDLDNIQGDILVGMKKKKELFFFFQINDVTAFKQHLASDIHPRITSTRELLAIILQPVTALNIAFSASGLRILGVEGATTGLGDTNFNSGQFATARAQLGDPQPTSWVEGFQGNGTHGVLLLASDTVENIDAELQSILSALGTSITERHRLQGSARPGDQEGHEHFGYMDGISQPAVKGFDTAPRPGQTPVDPGIFLLLEEGDTVARPAWAKDGSFLAFRQLKQRVPEFDNFLKTTSFNVEGLSADENAELLGARMVGRWKSGAPIDLAPRADDIALANDPNRNNNFNFTHPGEDLNTNQSQCPFSAHIRKTRPRADLGNNVRNHILRAGIPYGPEVTDAERASGITDDSQERGLAFVSYQSNLNLGFVFMQRAWANTASFLRGTGVDPIIGVIPAQTAFDVDRPITGLDPNDATRTITIEKDFVVSRGGEYFFSPSISSILDTLSV